MNDSPGSTRPVECTNSNPSAMRLSILEQIEHVRADARGILIPLGVPVAVDLPARAGALALLRRAPRADRGVRGAERAVRPEVRDRGDRARRGGRAHQFAAFGERPGHLDADLEANRVAKFPVDRDVPSAANTLLVQCVPHEPETLG